MAEELRRNQCSRVWGTAAYRNGKRQGTGRGTGFLAEDLVRKEREERGRRGSRSQNLPTLQDCLVFKKKNQTDKNRGERG